MNRLLQCATLFGATLLFAGNVLAHAGGDHVHTLAGGLMHPVTGWDHAVIALVVGLIAAQWREKSWRLPALFVGGMTLGVLAGVSLPFGGWIESGIVLSLLAAGLLLLMPFKHAGWRLSAAAVAVTGLSGVAHGMVHGVEAGAEPVYLFGVLGGTLMLHLAGIALGRSSLMSVAMLRAAGALTIVLGAAALIAN